MVMMERMRETASRRNSQRQQAVSAATRSDATGGNRISSLDERTQAGRALRDNVLRAEHRKWSKRGDHRDPIGLLKAMDKGRIPELLSIRYGRMLQSPFAFYRGAAGVMAADLAATPATGIRVQPAAIVTS
jgi:hypothetical protein